MIEGTRQGSIETTGAPQTERDYLEHFGEDAVRVLSPAPSFFSQAPFRGETPQPPAIASRTQQVREGSAHPKNTCGGCEGARRSRASRNPCNRCRRGKPACHVPGQGLFPSWGKPGRQRPLLLARLRASTNETTPSEMPLAPMRASQTFPREEAGASPRHGFSRAREQPRQTRQAPCRMLRHSQAPRRRRFHQPSLHLDFQHMAHGHDARDLHGNGDAQKRHPREAREEGTEKSSLTSENRATRTIGITLTCGPKALPERSGREAKRVSSSSPSTVSRAASSTRSMPPPFDAASSATETGELGNRFLPWKTESASRVLPPVSRGELRAGTALTGPFVAAPTCHRLKRLPRPKAHRHRAQRVRNDLAHTLAVCPRALRVNCARCGHAQGRSHAAYRSRSERRSPTPGKASRRRTSDSSDSSVAMINPFHGCEQVCNRRTNPRIAEGLPGQQGA